jgi:hypothetical protein
MGIGFAEGMTILVSLCNLRMMKKLLDLLVCVALGVDMV